MCGSRACKIAGVIILDISRVIKGEKKDRKKRKEQRTEIDIVESGHGVPVG